MSKTLNYYNTEAKTYFTTTSQIDFKEKHQFLLKYLKPHDHILDLGCGSGRDSLAFLQAGYHVTATDGSKELCELASQNISQPVKCQLFQDLDDVEQFDAIWACASLLHLSGEELKNVLVKVERALKKEGYLYVSFKHGTFEGYDGDRYFKNFTEASFNEFMSDFKTLEIIETQVTKDVLPNRPALSWLNVILKKLN